MRRKLRRIFLIAAVLQIPIGAAANQDRTPEWVKEARPDLLELTVRADLVIHGRVEDGRMKQPLIEVIEVLHGNFIKPELNVVFRHLNRLREPDEEPIVFPEGQEFILFLEPYPQADKPDRFSLVRDRFGQLELPPEGVDAYLEAVRLFSRLAAAPPSDQFTRTLDLLGTDNPLVASTALRQINKHRLATEEQVPILLRFLREGREDDRIAAAEVLENFLARTRRKRAGFDRETDVMNFLITAARNDDSVPVRSAAIGALQAWASTEAVDALEIIAETDSSQMVRFKAELSLLRIRRRAEQAIP
jgi:hypothetical protein